MVSLAKRLSRTEIDRRTFVAGCAAVAAAAGLSGYGTRLEKAEAAQANPVDTDGEWICARCNNKGCGGGSCINKVLVVDGVPIRQKSDDTHPDSPDYPQQRGCARGRSMRHQVFNADRLKYPMKRKGWSPDNPNGEMRGKDEWERISWDEALTYVADELKKAYGTYGPSSVLFAGYGGMSASTRTLAHLGGYMWPQDTASAGNFGFGPLDIGTGFNMLEISLGGMTTNDRFDIRNAETIVMYGCNPAWAAQGQPMYNYLQAKKAGANFIFVGPDYNATASTLGARWIPVRPGSDTAFLLGVAYSMLEQDDPETNPIIDWDFLDRYAVGFDADHMPADAKLNENFKDFILGAYDGIPRDPQWASERCGTPVEDIEWYANEIRKDKKVMIIYSYACARSNDAEDLPQALMTIGAMGGHMGKPGHACGLGNYLYHSANEGPWLINPGGLDGKGNMIGALEYAPNTLEHAAIPSYNMWKSILDGKFRFCGDTASSMGHFDTILPGEDCDLDIHVVYYDWHGAEKTQDLNNQIKALRSVDFVVTQDYTYSTACKYSDIILPTCSMWERWTTAQGGHREVFRVYQPVMDPLFESRTDDDIQRGLVEKLGLDVDMMFPYGEREKFFYSVAGATIVEEDGVTVSPLVTVTQDDIDEWGYEWTPQQGKIGLSELIDKGLYQIERKADDNYGYIGYGDFVQDPEANPRESVSGKLEIYCQAKADKLNSLGFSEYTCKPYPEARKPHRGYEDSFADWESRTPGEYPIQLFSPHYIGRCHNDLDNIKQVREAFYSPAVVNAQDAQARGVATGDTIRVYNGLGSVLRHAVVSNCIMPSTIAMGHGDRIDFDEENGVDRGGNENVLMGEFCGTFPASGYNTTLVNFEKYAGEPLGNRVDSATIAPEL